LFIRLVYRLGLALSAALVAGALVDPAGSSGSAAEPDLYRASFNAGRAAAKPEYEPNAVLMRFKKNATASIREAALAKIKGKPGKRVHVEDPRAGMPYPSSYDAASAAELRAEAIANAWWGPSNDPHSIRVHTVGRRR
jgi:hypothetical protein